MAYQLPDLEFKFDELEPHLDELTMRIHYTKHHAGYLKKINEAINGTGLEKKSVEEILANVSQFPDDVRNSCGGHYNHSFFWRLLTPQSNGIEDVNLFDAIIKYFGTIQNLKEEFTNAALNQFGSGWAWLIKKHNEELRIYSTANQDNPLMDVTPIKGRPLLCVDIWEHAYYLKYKNDRAAYIDAFWKLINWGRVAELYKK